MDKQYREFAAQLQGRNRAVFELFAKHDGRDIEMWRVYEAANPNGETVDSFRMQQTYCGIIFTRVNAYLQRAGIDRMIIPGIARRTYRMVPRAYSE